MGMLGWIRKLFAGPVDETSADDPPDWLKMNLNPIRISTVADYLKLEGILVIVFTIETTDNPDGGIYTGRVISLSDTGERLFLDKAYKDKKGEYTMSNERISVTLSEIDTIAVIDKGEIPSL